MNCIKTGLNIGFYARGETYRGDLFSHAGVAIANVNPNSALYETESADIIIIDAESRCEFGEQNVYVFRAHDAIPRTEIGRKALAMCMDEDS